MLSKGKSYENAGIQQFLEFWHLKSNEDFLFFSSSIKIVKKQSRMQHNMFRLFLISATVFTFTACSQKTTAQTTTEPMNAPQEQGPRQGQRGGPPSFADKLAKMDANQDGKLAQSEVQGPLQEHFAKIDTNEDGFITEEEMKNAPNPPRPNRN